MDDDRVSPPTAVTGEPLPCLIYTHGNGKSKKVQTFSTSAFNNRSYLKSIPEMRGKSVRAAGQGWLLLRDERSEVEDPDNYSFTLLNPYTLKSIHLPALNFHDEGRRGVQCALTSPPSDEVDSNCCFIFLFFKGWAFSCLIRADSSCGCWVSRRIELDGEAPSIYHPVALNGVVYGTADFAYRLPEYLVCFEVVSDNDGSNSSIDIKPLPHIKKPERPVLWFMLQQTWFYTLESCGSIYEVHVGTRHYSGVYAVRVLELDLDRGKWVGVKCLGDRAFLLANYGSTWCSATGTVKGNSVYFHDTDCVHEAVVCYSLSDCSSTFLACPKLLNPRTCWPVWVAPPQLNRFVPMSITCDRYSATRQSQKCEKGKPSDAVSTMKCVSQPQDDNLSGNNLNELPLHIIELISEHMHLFDYWNFRRTCKLIHSETSIPQWRTSNSLPLLMVFEGDGGLCRVMDPCRDDSPSFVLQFSQHVFDINFSKNGWLLITDKSSLQYYNPFTRERGDLPPVPWPFMSIGFSSYPTCPSCVTVSINNYYGDEVVIHCLQFGDKEWNSWGVDINEGDEFNPGFCSPTYYAGGFYVLDKDTANLGVFELVDGDPDWTVYHNRPPIRAGEIHSSYLVVCGEELISVFIGKNGSWIQVFKLNNTKKKKKKMKWVRVKDLGNHILFISHVSCYSVVTKESNMKNRIYVPWLKGNRIVYYSLKTEKYHVEGSDDYYDDFFFMKQPFRCCWM
ncbi:hypothetical protein RND81_02G045600 [Saponaria officinalis]|uniref:KIB1-4 beta-propeller domain-containing protein n=1 Tax=Saponaria officinalis TaxID=3572 RepID=A0AAW1MQF9_SAPOF